MKYIRLLWWEPVSMTKQKLVWGTLAALLAVAVSCTDWQTWDQLFERHPLTGNRAWTGGDGAFSIPLDKPGRTLWVFGDFLPDWL